MQLKLMKIATGPFVLMTTILYAVAGLLLGIVIAIASAVAPSEEGPNLGGWAILIFPLINSMVGAFSAWMMTLAYNLFAKNLGGLEFEFEQKPV